MIVRTVVMRLGRSRREIDGESLGDSESALRVKVRVGTRSPGN
jgi:hypothetical protein